MQEIPLFPLNTVLFPGMPLPLHIFEDRYKEMIQLCLTEKRPFGVVLIHDGVAEGGPAEPHLVGCSADIIQVQQLADERLFIMALGKERFRIISLQNDRPYLVGIVEPAPLQNEVLERQEIAAARLHPLVTGYLAKLADIGRVDFTPDKIPTNPLELFYMGASLLQVPSDLKQALLEKNRVTSALTSLYHLYHQEVSLMQTMPKEDMGIFSLS